MAEHPSPRRKEKKERRKKVVLMSRRCTNCARPDGAPATQTLPLSPHRRQRARKQQVQLEVGPQGPVESEAWQSERSRGVCRKERAAFGRDGTREAELGADRGLAITGGGGIAGIRLLHVPYKGMGAAVQDLIAGNVSSTLDITTMAMVHAGKLRALAVASDRRYPREPTVPSFGESGLPGLELVTWLSLHGPAGLPPELVLRINADVNRALAMPEVKAGIEAMNLDPVGGSPADLQAMLGRERSRYAELIRQAGITVD